MPTAFLRLHACLLYLQVVQHLGKQTLKEFGHRTKTLQPVGTEAGPRIILRERSGTEQPLPKLVAMTQ